MQGGPMGWGQGHGLRLRWVVVHSLTYFNTLPSILVSSIVLGRVPSLSLDPLGSMHLTMRMQ